MGVDGTDYILSRGVDSGVNHVACLINFKRAINNFIALANVNPAAQSISRDLLVGASAIFIWIVNESKKLNMKNMWVVYVGTFLIAFAFSAPFFLFLRERRIIELEEN